MVIDLKEICKDYIQGKEAVPVLKNVNLSVDSGEYLAIMGPSGSGKSTLMNIIGCLDRQTSGNFIFDGSDISVCKDKELSEIRNKKIGFVFQNFNLLPRQSAVENVELPLLYAGVPKKERREMAKEALVKVGLEERMNFKPTQLSGGQKQRVAIARAMVNSPALLLADEPTSALDVTVQKQVVEELLMMRKEYQTAMILVTHNIGVVRAMADRILVLQNGTVRDYGETKNVLDHSQDPYTQKLMNSVLHLKREHI